MTRGTALLEHEQLGVLLAVFTRFANEVLREEVIDTTKVNSVVRHGDDNKKEVEDKTKFYQRDISRYLQSHHVVDCNAYFMHCVIVLQIPTFVHLSTSFNFTISGLVYLTQVAVRQYLLARLSYPKYLISEGYGKSTWVILLTLGVPISITRNVRDLLGGIYMTVITIGLGGGIGWGYCRVIDEEFKGGHNRFGGVRGGIGGNNR